MNSSPTPAAAAAAGYFVDQKKGEVNELKQLLKNINVERDPKRKRDIIKKVIAYMTLGIDVSRLFTEMIMAIETKDIVVKKMVYHYLCNYAHKNPDLAIMCINTLRRDCDNEDPMVRGLALRSLCGLRLESVLEYVEQPLVKSLTDLSGYVRKTGVMGILKLYNLSPSTVTSSNYVQQLYTMLQDVDASVVTNVILVLDEIFIDKGGMDISSATIMQLLNRIGDFSEWGLNAVLDLVARYKPAADEETFAIMNLLDPVLRTANSGAVLATLKSFLQLTASFQDLHPQLYARAKPPLLTLMNTSHAEIQFSVLKHLGIILPCPAARGIFDDEFRQFFVRYNEPPHVKHMKVGLIPYISNSSNALDIATELCEYVTDVDSELSIKAIHALGSIATRVTSASALMTSRLVDLIDLDIPYVRAESMKNLADIVRVFPDMKSLIVPSLSRCLRRVEDSEAKAAVVWMIGEFGQEIVEAPYMLEPIIDGYEEELSSNLKIHVLVAAMKLFFKRPPEMQAMLGRLLKFAINDLSNQDVHDRALLYYRLLATNANVASSLFTLNTQIFGNGEKSDESRHIFAESTDDDLRSQVLLEFNSLAVIYEAPSIRFIEEKYQRLHVHCQPSSSLGDGNPREFQQTTPINAVQPQLVVVQPQLGTVPAQVQSEQVNLLDWDESPSTSNSSSSTLSSKLREDIILLPAEFQKLWGDHSEAFNQRLCMIQRIPQTTGEVEALMRTVKIFTIASGQLPSPAVGMKFFFYAVEMDSSGVPELDLLSAMSTASSSTSVLYHLVQLVVHSTSGEIVLTLRTSGDKVAACTLVPQILKTALNVFGVVNV